MQQYQQEYNEFVANYKLRQVSAEEVGEIISRMAQYYGEKNNLLCSCSEGLSKKAAMIVQSEDENTGKPISVAKADILINATDESIAYNRGKTDLQNIEQYINALKSLQKGLLNEFAHSSLT
jgi:hypothetical protein